MIMDDLDEIQAEGRNWSTSLAAALLTILWMLACPALLLSQASRCFSSCNISMCSRNKTSSSYLQ